jgi:pimeloyl-ACP methyl ester carboxylesterase
MAVQRRWARHVFGLATGTGLIGLTVTSGLTFLAHYFVTEFSRPHVLLPEAMLSWGRPHSYGEPPRLLQRSLLCKTSDGTLLRGDFWAQPQQAPTVVLCHGYRSSREHLRTAMELEYACGYNVLSFDFRGHGESDSVLTSAGNAEVRDLEAALYAARQQPETLPGKIILHGFSMGAAVSLLMPPHPDVVAIIADSPYARSDDIMQRLINFRLQEFSNGWQASFLPLRRFLPLVAWCTVILSAIDFWFRYGFSVIARPDISFQRWQKPKVIPILLMHSSGDELIPIAHARQLVERARTYGVPLETYFADVNIHCGAYGSNPAQYNRVIQQFLEHHLGKDMPEQHRQIVINEG